MQHKFSLSGEVYRLRPVLIEDAEYIHNLRSNPLLNEYLHPGSNQLQDQIQWLSNYFERENDYYFVVERIDNLEREGLISLYDIRITELNQGEWGRWILKPGSLAAVESAFLIYKFAFEVLKLNMVYCRTVANNLKVVSFHDSCGLNDKKKLLNYFDLKSSYKFDAIEHKLYKEFWPSVSINLLRLINLVALRAKRS